MARRSLDLNPAKVQWVTSAYVKPIELFAEGKIDAFLGLPQEPQRLRAKNIGHVIVKQRAGSAMSRIFLLHVGGESRIRSRKTHRTKRVVSRQCSGRRICA